MPECSPAKQRHSNELDALQRQTLFVCSPKYDLKYERLMRATFGEVAVANLGISSDIALAQSDDGLTAARLVFSP